MEPISHDLIKLVNNLAWVALFAYIVNRSAEYAMARLKVYGQRGDMFPPATGWMDKPGEDSDDVPAAS